MQFMPKLNAAGTAWEPYPWDDSTEALPIPVEVPEGFRWTAQPLNLRRTAVGVATDFLISSLIPAVTNTWYVDPVNGNDGTGVVNNRALPLKNLSTALAKADVDQVRIINLAADFFARTTASWNNTRPTRSCSVIVEGPYRFVSIQCASAVLPTWTAHATLPNVYETTITAANAKDVTDLSYRVPHPASARQSIKAAQVLDAVRTPYGNLNLVASEAAVGATPGSYFHNGTKLVVQAYNSRNLVGDQFMQPTASSNNGRFPDNVNNLSIYCKGIDFVGGRPFYVYVTEAAAPTGCSLFLEDCTFQHGGLANGLDVQFNATIILYRCGAYYNFNDGLNFHCPFAPADSGRLTSPKVIEIECVSWGNGESGSTAASDNATTAHEFTDIVSLNCVYPGSNDRTMADINSAMRWAMGCVIGPATSVAAGKENVAVLNSARLWLDTCIVPRGANPPFAVDGTSVLAHFNSGSVTNTPGYTGTVQPYLG